jgi:hypothetical protein
MLAAKYERKEFVKTRDWLRDLNLKFEDVIAVKPEILWPFYMKTRVKQRGGRSFADGTYPMAGGNNQASKEVETTYQQRSYCCCFAHTCSNLNVPEFSVVSERSSLPSHGEIQRSFFGNLPEFEALLKRKVTADGRQKLSTSQSCHIQEGVFRTCFVLRSGSNCPIISIPKRFWSSAGKVFSPIFAATSRRNPL